MRNKSISIIAILVLLSMATGCSDAKEATSIEQAEIIEEETVKVVLSQIDFADKDYYDVMESLKADGFTNVDTEEHNDLSSEDEEMDNLVEKVTIDGSESYDVGSSYLPDVDVKIIYHNIETVYPPFSSEEIPDEAFGSISKQFENAGFVNVTCKPIDDLVFGWLTEDGEVESITIDELESFEDYNSFAFDTEVVITYHTFPQEDEEKDDSKDEDIISAVETELESTVEPVAESIDEPTSEPTVEPEAEPIVESTPEPSDEPEAESIAETTPEPSEVAVTEESIVSPIPSENLTIENNEELATLFNDGENEDLCVAFVDKYKGKAIEFDGYIAYMSNHGDYTARYDILIYAGDNSEDRTYVSPAMQFSDVNTTSDLHFTGDAPDYIGEGDKLHIVAEVDDIQNNYLIILEPISVSVR